MKKIISLLLCVVMALSALALTSCGGTEEKLKLGLGVYSVVEKATNAEGDTNGEGQVVITAAAVLVDKDGKIVKCTIDSADNTVSYTSEGKAIAKDSFKTKYELGYDYNMKTYGNATKEWFEQADAFCALVAGKTMTEVKALVAENGKGNSEVVNAGCTIAISEFVLALEKAVNNAVASEATANDTIKLGVSTEQTNGDANGDANGQSQLETTLFAAAVGKDGKIVAAYSECVQVAFTFDANGASKYDTTKAISGKREMGDAYNMKAYGNAAKEWYEQAAAFDAACIGKKAGKVSSLLGENGYGNADLKSAGCTVLVNGFVKAAAKIG